MFDRVTPATAQLNERRQPPIPNPHLALGDGHEPSLFEMGIEGESGRHAVFLHCRERRAICETPIFVGVLFEYSHPIGEDPLAGVDHVYELRCEGCFSKFDGFGVAVCETSQCYGLVEDMLCCHEGSYLCLPGRYLVHQLCRLDMEVVSGVVVCLQSRRVDEDEQEFISSCKGRLRFRRT